jgi:predicted DNA binding CopG/RHH family protein
MKAKKPSAKRKVSFRVRLKRTVVSKVRSLASEEDMSLHRFLAEFLEKKVRKWKKSKKRKELRKR